MTMQLLGPALGIARSLHFWLLLAMLLLPATCAGLIFRIRGVSV